MEKSPWTHLSFLFPSLHPYLNMPIPIIAQAIRDGISSIPYAWTFIRIAPWVLIFAALKYYFEGARNRSERMMRSKVVMVTVRHFSLAVQPISQANKKSKPLGWNLRDRRRSSPGARNSRRSSYPPYPPTTLRSLPLRIHRRSAR